MRKKFLVIIIVLLSVIGMTLIIKSCSNRFWGEKVDTIAVDFVGTIMSYEMTEEGMLIVLKLENGDEVTFIYTEESLHSSDEIIEVIQSQGIGIEVSIRSEYKTIENEVYPVTVIGFKEDGF